MGGYINHSWLKHEREISRAARKAEKLARRDARRLERIASHQGQVHDAGSPYETKEADDV